MRYFTRIGRLALAFLLFSAAWTPLRAESGPPPGNEISQGLWWLYNLQYEKAHSIFKAYSEAHPKDPAGDFYMSATDWWQLAQQFDYALPDIEKRFEADVESTMKRSQDLLSSTADDHQKALAYLYGGGAEGLKGRWLVTQKQWVKAYFLGKDGHAQLVKSLKLDPTLYDADMGLGIYDYYTDIYGGLIGVLSTLLIHGDRARGIREILLSIEKGTYAAGEARVFLVEIYTFEEGTPAKALPYVNQLCREYPDSPAMHLAKITTLYSMQDWPAVETQARLYLEKSENDIPYYRKEGVQPALYCLGVAALFGKKDPQTCLRYMQRILDLGVDSNRWVSFAYLRRGEVHDARGERQDAIDDYQRVLSRKDFWGSHREAEEHLKKPFVL